MLVAGDMFRMASFCLMRRITEEMDGVFGEFGLTERRDESCLFGADVLRAVRPGVKSVDVHEWESDLTEVVIGAAFEVANVIGAGFLEKLYEL